MVPKTSGPGSRRHARLVKAQTGDLLAEHVLAPRTVFGRALGLMFRSRLDDGHGMWINPCNGIHMFFMRFSIDAVFLDRRLRIVRIVHGLEPWRMVPFVWLAHSVVELPAGSARAAGLAVGEQLRLDD